MEQIARIDILRKQITEHETSLQALKAELSALESAQTQQHESSSSSEEATEESRDWPWPMESGEYTRYGRQMILPGFGLPGQLELRASKVLIVGLGGLGCPAAAYLAGAGVGTIGLVDGDVVEISNLHRQILHSTDKVGLFKVESAAKALKSINSHPKYITYTSHLDPMSALEIFPQYDLILDCTDMPQTRYLISDAAVICGKPLISASALRTDGQLMILNHPPAAPKPERVSPSPAGPCYRCVFPRPPPPESVTSCGEGGILGPVVGTMGVLMALEAIKMISYGTVALLDGPRSPRLSDSAASSHSLLMLSASGSGPTSFRSIRLKGKRADCVACSENATITKDSLTSGSLDYAAFCGAASSINLLSDSERLTVTELAALRKLPPRGSDTSSILVDVRDQAQFSICSLPGSVNISWTDMQMTRALPEQDQSWADLRQKLKESPDSDISVICRLGNDSQHAVRKIQELGILKPSQQAKDVVGGFRAWKKDIDPDWPEY